MTSGRSAAIAAAAVLSCAALLASTSHIRTEARAAAQHAEPPVPGPFVKVAPANLRTGMPPDVTLQWTASAPPAAAAARATPALTVHPGPQSVLRAASGDVFARTGVGEGALLQDAPATASFIVIYEADVPMQVRTAFQHAVNIWSALINSSVPIEVTVSWDSLSPGVLTTGGPQDTGSGFDTLPFPSTAYPTALLNKLAQAGDLFPGNDDITITINSSSNWYFGTNGNPPAGQWDLVTAVLSRLATGLGFIGTGRVTPATGGGFLGTGGVPIIYDRFVEDGGGRSLLDAAVYPQGSVALGNAIRSNDLWWGGARAGSANGGLRPRLSAPAVFQFGVSYSYFDEAYFPPGHPDSLMTPFLNSGEAIHAPGAAALGVLLDVGWTTGPAVLTYEYCLDASPDGACDTGWKNVGNVTSVAVSGLLPGTTYSWQVRSSMGFGFRYANSGTWFSFTTRVNSVVPGDFDGNGAADLALYRNGQWLIRNQATRLLGGAGDVPVPGDYDGDRIMDVAVYRPATGQWFIGDDPPVGFGRSGDIPVPADYDGDGTTDMAFFRTTDGVATWVVQNILIRNWGLRGDIPRPGDFDGDGKVDLAVYRPSNGTWYFNYSASGFATTESRQWGLPGDVPVIGDFDGDHRADLTVFRGSIGHWFIMLSRVNHGSNETHSWGIPGDVPIALDVNGDGFDELVVYRPGDGTWHAFDRVSETPVLETTGDASNAVQQGVPGDIPVMEAPRIPSTRTSDFDGDGRSDITVHRSTLGQWFTRFSSSNYAATAMYDWGIFGDVRAPGDYDGDRRADIAVYRPSTGFWFLRFSSTRFTTFRAEQWGVPGDVPAPADYDGDGKTDPAVFRPSSGQWFVKVSSTNYTTSIVAQWGLPGDTPKPADYDGDGRAELAVYRPATREWFLKLSGIGFGTSRTKQWGLAGDVPIAADFDGDGRADLAVYRPSSGTWFAADALTGIAPLNRQWGLLGDIPVTHDFDGDGVSDVAVYRPSIGTWFVRRSGNGSLLQIQWGLSIDTPVQRAGSAEDRR